MNKFDIAHVHCMVQPKLIWVTCIVADFACFLHIVILAQKYNVHYDEDSDPLTLFHPIKISHSVHCFMAFEVGVNTHQAQ